MNDKGCNKIETHTSTTQISQTDLFLTVTYRNEKVRKCIITIIVTKIALVFKPVTFKGSKNVKKNAGLIIVINNCVNLLLLIRSLILSVNVITVFILLVFTENKKYTNLCVRCAASNTYREKKTQVL